MAEQVTHHEFRGSKSLWFGVLAGPLAWAVQLLVGSELPELVCSPGARTETVLGLSLDAFGIVLTAVLAAVTVAGGLVALRCWRLSRHEDHVGGRPAWMGAAGIMTNILFLFLILPGFFPSVFLTGCGGSL